jgi:hypothetical protein
MLIFGPDFWFGQGFVLSVLVGVILGMLLGVKYGYPKSWVGYAVVLMFNMLSPMIGVDTWIIGMKPMGLYIVLNYTLFGLFATLNLAFLWRLSSSKKRVAEA